MKFMIILFLISATYAGETLFFEYDGAVSTLPLQTLCAEFPSNVRSTKLVMGEVVDYFRPIEGATWCDMINSYRKHEFSYDGINWVTPAYHNNPGGWITFRGGSASFWPRDHGRDGDNRQHLSVWAFNWPTLGGYGAYDYNGPPNWKADYKFYYITPEVCTDYACPTTGYTNTGGATECSGLECTDAECCTAHQVCSDYSCGSDFMNTGGVTICNGVSCTQSECCTEITPEPTAEPTAEPTPEPVVASSNSAATSSGAAAAAGSSGTTSGFTNSADAERNTFCGGTEYVTYIDTDGSVWVSGELWMDMSEALDGSDDQKLHLTPVQIRGLPSNARVVEIGCQGYSIDMLLDNGEIWHIGRNTEGYMPSSCATPGRRTHKVCKNDNLGSDVQSILGVNTWGSIFVRKTDGTVWATGNMYGINLVFGSAMQIEITGVDMSRVKQVACDAEYNCIVLAENGDTYFMGRNRDGQRGNGSQSPIESWEKTEMSEVQWISGNMDGFHFLKLNGDLWAVGGNVSGQLGLGRTADAAINRYTGLITTFTQVNTDALYPNGINPIVKFYDWGNQVWYIHSDGTVSYSGWLYTMATEGSDSNGDSNGLIVSHQSLNDWLTANGREVYDIANSWYNTAWVLLDNGEVISFGDNRYGEIGLGSASPKNLKFPWGNADTPARLGVKNIQRARFTSNVMDGVPCTPQDIVCQNGGVPVRRNGVCGCDCSAIDWEGATCENYTPLLACQNQLNMFLLGGSRRLLYKY